MQVLFVRILIVFPYLLFLCPSKAYRNFLQSSISQHNIWLRSKFSSAATCLSNSRKPLKFTNKDQQEDYLRDLSTIDDWILKEGESGIDIFGVVKDSNKFLAWREAEIKHGRLAMLAAFGWPISELYHYKISKVIGMDDLLAKGERAPSVLNGGLDNLYVLIGLSIFLLVGAGLELQLQKRRKEQPEELQNFLNMWREDGWDAPGNYGFDPLHFSKIFCPSPKSKVMMQNIEIFNGRLAMLATVGYVVQEYLTGLPVVNETPQFFHFS